MPDKINITAIILAGGKSTRMKTEKGLIYLGNKTLIEHVIESVKKITDNIIIITQNHAYEMFGFPCFADVLENKGALGGIYSGLSHSLTKKNLILGCDMPFLSESLLKCLVNNCDDEDVLLASHINKAEPLCSIYDKNCVVHIRPLLEQNQLKITSALEGLKTRVISFDNEDWFAGNEFTNINSIDEIRKYEL